MGMTQPKAHINTFSRQHFFILLHMRCALRKPTEKGRAAAAKLAATAEIQRRENAVFRILLSDLRVYLNQTRKGDCWKSGKVNQDGFDEFYFC